MELTQLTGLEMLRGIADGTVPAPPMGQLMGFDLVEVDEGRAVFAATPSERLYNPLGSVHGGFAATLLDSATGCAVQTLLDAGVAYTTVELSVNLVRGMSADTGRVICEGRAIHVGRRVATAEARLIAEDTGKLLAHGTATCLVTG
jgi:uncharacterized protein (TIGR00369 family)